MIKLAIFGAGGFGRETYYHFVKYCDEAIFIVDDEFFDEAKEYQIKTIPLSKFDPNEYLAVVAVGDPTHRKQIVERFPKNTKWAKLIHESAIVLDSFNEIGEGCIICAGTILTTNIKLGKHAHLNLNSTVGHDCIIGDYFTTAPGAHISGNVTAGDCVYFGTNASVKEKITICSNATIGMNAAVTKNILEPGIYVGTPASRLNR